MTTADASRRPGWTPATYYPDPAIVALDPRFEKYWRQGAPFEYLLYAKMTSGTTERNNSKQRDYTLSLELTNVHTGVYDVQSAEIRKGYHKSAMGKIWNYNPLKS